MDMTLWAQSRRDKAFKVALLLFLLSFSDYISEQLKVSPRYLLTLLFFISPALHNNLHSWQCNVSITCGGRTGHLDAPVRNVSSRVESCFLILSFEQLSNSRERKIKKKEIKNDLGEYICHLSHY